MGHDELLAVWLDSMGGELITCLMLDNQLAKLIFGPNAQGLFGLQVSGEDAIRWRSAGQLSREGHALIEIVAPQLPHVPSVVLE
jgi:hypothetical protein